MAAAESVNGTETLKFFDDAAALDGRARRRDALFRPVKFGSTPLFIGVLVVVFVVSYSQFKVM